MSNPDKKIVLDADVLSHFIKGYQLDKLSIIYPQRLIILDIVKQEISARSGWDVIIDSPRSRAARNHRLIVYFYLCSLTPKQSFGECARVIQNFIDDSDVQELNFPEDEEYIIEYAHLTSIRGHALGKGESACLVYCRFNKNILASSNLKDIHRYCDFHKIEYIRTQDIILKGYRQGILSEDECDDFIQTIKSKGSKFPYNSLSEILDM